MKQPASNLFIVDNKKVDSYLTDWCGRSNAVDVATGYLEIGALLGGRHVAKVACEQKTP